MLRTRPEGPRFLQLGAGRGNIVAATPLIPPHPCPSPPGRGRRARGEVGAGEEGLCTAIPSIPQSPAGDSSPYEGEPKGSKVAPEARILFAPAGAALREGSLN